MWTWQRVGQWGDGATVSFNAVNSPTFSSSLAIPFFVPGHLIAALIYGSTRLPLPIYRYFIKITPLNRVNVCFFFSYLPLLTWAVKLHRVPCTNFCDIRQIKQCISPKAQRDERRDWMKGDQSFCRQSLVPACLFFSGCCVCLPPTWMAHCHEHCCPLIRITCHLFTVTWLSVRTALNTVTATSCSVCH